MLFDRSDVLLCSEPLKEALALTASKDPFCMVLDEMTKLADCVTVPPRSCVVTKRLVTPKVPYIVPFPYVLAPAVLANVVTAIVLNAPANSFVFSTRLKNVSLLGFVLAIGYIVC